MLKFFVFSIVLLAVSVNSDKPCAARQIKGQSVVCVCNSTYCDDFTRDVPQAGNYNLYTSTKEGLRFSKSSGSLTDIDNGHYAVKITVNTSLTYQTIEGFGGAFTDAAGVNWRNLSEVSQKYFVESYCSSSGLEYNMFRVPIGGCDFSTHPYAYNMYPEDDSALSNFTLTDEDWNLKIPMIKQCQALATSDLHLVASTWSPPTWMKTSGKWQGFSRLKEEYYQTYADYHLRFLEEYKKAGIDVWAITTTNEPFNGVLPFVKFQTLGWTPKHMAQYISENLGPTIRNSSFNGTKILAHDDQRGMLPVFFDWMVANRPSTLDWLDGIAVHWYTDLFTPTSILDSVHKNHPDKFLLATEASEGPYPWELSKVKIGSWDRAESYIHSIIEDITHNFVGWLDWNLALDPTGGPNWSDTHVDSPIIVYPGKDEFIKQPMFYAMGHFSKFVPRGSLRVDADVDGGKVEAVAFSTTKGSVVVVLHNKSSFSRKVAVRVGGRQVVLDAVGHSIHTVEMIVDSSSS